MKADFEKGTKICCRCKEELPVTMYNKDPQKKSDGLAPYCKKCRKIAADWKKEGIYEKNKEKNCARSKEKIVNDPEFREKSRLRSKKFRESNPNYNKEHYSTDEAKAIAKKANRNRVENGKQLAWIKKKKLEDLLFGLTRVFRSRLNQALRYDKLAHSMELLGCSWEEFKAHIESLFQEGMTWENRGKDGWHLDHIILVSYFDFTIEENQRICFNWRNLQPLWKEDNLRKKDKLPEDYQERLERIRTNLK